MNIKPDPSCLSNPSVPPEPGAGLIGVPYLFICDAQNIAPTTNQYTFTKTVPI